MNTERFYHPLHESIGNADYCYDDSKYIQILNCLNQMSNDAFYIIDYCKWTFLHVASNGLFLSGHSPEQVRDAGFDHYEKTVHQEDLKMMERVNKLGFDLFYSFPREDRLRICFSHDFRTKNRQGGWDLVNQRLIPLELTSNGAIRLSICKVSIPTSNKPGNALITVTDSSRAYRFSDIRQAFVSVGESKLSETATLIITLSGQGLSEKEIADYLGIGIYTVKHHKKAIFKKLNVKNMSGAVQWLNNHKIVYNNF